MDSILRLPAVMQKVGLSRSSVYLQVSQGNFPRPLRITKGSVGWSSNEIDAWIQDKLESSPTSTMKSRIGEAL